MRHRPASVLALLSLLGFQGLSGVAGGLGLVYDPSGSTVGLPLELLEESPFGDYMVPGLILLLALGVVPCLVAIALWNRRRWARMAGLLVGAALVFWIVVQVGLIGYQAEPPLQMVYGAIGVIIVGLASFPSVKWDLEEDS